MIRNFRKKLLSIPVVEMPKKRCRWRMFAFSFGGIGCRLRFPFSKKESWFPVSTDVVVLGYTCPHCGRRVAVLRSSNPPKTATEMVAKCDCGKSRKIGIEQLQKLDVWKEKSASA